jgi:periplasmic divalent cation tolerance protein
MVSSFYWEGNYRMDKLAMVYITVPSVDEGRSLAKGLIEARLAACVNYWQNLASVYRWEGELCEEQEVVMLVKTTEGSFGRVKEFIEKHHSYALPCIMQLDVAQVNPAYGTWVREEVNS